ncbi:MAG: hypothetical protein ACYDHN_14945 [Solirubrobacteraceae bacterium]
MQGRPQQEGAPGVNVGRNTDPHLPRALGEAAAPNTTHGEGKRPHGQGDHGKDRRYLLDSDERMVSEAGESA